MLTLEGKVHGSAKQTKTGFVQKILTEDELITVFSKDLDTFTPDSNGMLNLSVQAKDNFVFAG